MIAKGFLNRWFPWARAFVLLSLLGWVGRDAAQAAEGAAVAADPRFVTFNAADVKVEQAAVRYREELDLLVFEQRLVGRPGATLPVPRGQLDGAPVLAYVFPTDLASTEVGFGPAEGIVALAVTFHPDFDDTPLWDEDGDRDYANDGGVAHPHWVLLVPDTRVAGGLSVRELAEGAEVMRELPPTQPGMPMYMDSPGFSVVLNDDTLRVLVPRKRLGGRKDFHFDAVTAFLRVSTSGGPMLGVQQVFHVLSGDLSLPYAVDVGDPAR